MNEISYPYTVEYRYRFVSCSPFKEIRKIASITTTDNPLVFNMALLDELETGELSDTSKPDNKDFRMIMATVFRIADSFLFKNQESWIVFRGSDQRRQRLYRIILGIELGELLKRFVILGVVDGKTSLFEVNKHYEYFLIGSKS